MCFIFYLDFNLLPSYYNFFCDSDPLSLSLQRESDKSLSLKTLEDRDQNYLSFFKACMVTSSHSQ